MTSTTLRDSGAAWARPPQLGRRPQLSRLWRTLPVLGLGLGLGCAGDHLTREPPVEPGVLYTALELNHHAVTLSVQPPYDTLTLQATPLNAHGEPLPDLGTPQYSSANLDRVQVDSNGVLRAVALTAVGQPVAVVATLTSGNLKHVDSVLVKVVADTLPKLASLSILADSAKIPLGTSFFGAQPPVPIQVVDSNGSSISDSLVAERSSDPSTLEVRNDGFASGRLVLQGKRLGEATLVASTTIFGITKADTVLYRVGWPIVAMIRLQQVPDASGPKVDPPTVRVGVGAVVVWEGVSAGADVAFADKDLPNIRLADESAAFFVQLSKLFGIPASIVPTILGCGSTADCDGSGEFVLSPETQRVAYRLFAAPGTYEYHSSLLETTGRVIVMDER